MDKKLGIVGAALVMVLVLTFFAGCGEEGPKVDPVVYTKASKTESFNGYVGDPDHGTEPTTQTFMIGGNGTLVIKATVTLTWSDDESADDSEPDELMLTISGGGESASQQDTGGGITLMLGANSSSEEEGSIPANMGDLEVTVTCIECGFTPDRKNWGLIRLGHHDPGNDFQLTVKYDFLKMEGGSSEPSEEEK